MAQRPDLRLVVSSATLDALAIRSFFGENVGILSVEGRMFPVEIHHALEPVRDYVGAALECVLAIHTTEGPGDVLVFLTGQEEVTRLVDQLAEATAECALTPFACERFP